MAIFLQQMALSTLATGSFVKCSNPILDVVHERDARTIGMASFDHYANRGYTWMTQEKMTLTFGLKILLRI